MQEIIIISVLGALVALVIYCSIDLIRQINRIKDEPGEGTEPTEGSYEDLLKYRRGRSKH